MSKFLNKATELGEVAHSDLSHGNGTSTEADAKDWIEFYGEHMQALKFEYERKKLRLYKRFPNLNK